MTCDIILNVETGKARFLLYNTEAPVNCFALRAPVSTTEQIAGAFV